MSPVVLDLNEEIAGLIQMMRRLVGENIDLVWKPASELRPVKIDPSQIDQILANLCVNARDAVRDDGGTITIATENASIDRAYCRLNSEASPGEYSVLVVSDDGEGMDNMTLNQIFEPFFTTKPTCQGTGLGLSTVYGIVKQNNGFINVSSKPGKGTCFRIYLPSAKEDKAPETRKAGNQQLRHGSETILLVEDEPAVSHLARSFLADFGYRVIEAELPSVALKLLSENSGDIDLMITDVFMPEMNGRELAEKIQKNYPDIKVLFISGYIDNAIMNSDNGALEEGVNFLSKPFQRDELILKVRSVLEE